MPTHTELDVGALLSKYDLLKPDEVAAAAMEKISTGRSIKDIVLAQGLVSEDALYFAISAELNLPFVTVEADAVDKELLAPIPLEVLKEYKFLPLLEVENEVRVAVADPTNQELLTSLNKIFAGKTVSISVALASNILDTIEALRAEKKEEPVGAQAPGIKSPAVAVYYSQLTEAAVKGAEILYFEAVDKQLRIRQRVKGRLTEVGSFGEELLEPIIEKIKSTVNLEKGNSASIKTEIAGKEVFLTAGILTAGKKQGAFIRFRYPVRKTPLDKLPIPQENIDMIKKALFGGRGLILVTGGAKDLRETVAQSLLLEFNPGRRKVMALLQEEHHLPEVECYVLKDAGDLNDMMALIADVGLDALYVQDIRRPGLNLYRLLQLAENTTVIASAAAPRAKDAWLLLERGTPGLDKEQRPLLLGLEAQRESVPCTQCSDLGWAAGKGCRQCGYTGINRYEEKIGVVMY